MTIKYDKILGELREEDSQDVKLIDYANTKIYNALEGLKHFKASLEVAKAGLLTSPLYINCYGDSITEGGVCTNVNKTWADKLRSWIKTYQNINTSTGFIHPLYPIAQSGTNPFWTFGNDYQENYGYGVHSSCKRVSVNGAVATLPFYGTGIDVYALTGNFDGANEQGKRAFKLYIDDIEIKTFDTYTNGSNDFFDNTTIEAENNSGIIRGLEEGNHVLKVESVISDGKTAYLMGAIPYNGDGFVVNNMGYWGQTAKEYYQSNFENGNSNYARFDAHITNWMPKLSFISFGANDLGQQKTVAEYTEYIQKIIDAIRLNNLKADIILLSLGEYDDSVLVIKQVDYENALLELAELNNCCFINATGTTDIADVKAVTSGGVLIEALNYDSVHPNDAGHNHIYNMIIQAIQGN